MPPWVLLAWPGNQPCWTLQNLFVTTPAVQSTNLSCAFGLNETANLIQTDVFLHLTFVPYLLLLSIATFLLNQIDWVKRMLTPAWDQCDQVGKRALLEFYQSNIKKTKDATGILFFVSILERKAIVLADKAISDQLPKETWTEIVNLITSGMKRKDLASGLEKALINSGNILKPLFPIKPGDVNELPNKLIIKE